MRHNNILQHQLTEDQLQLSWAILITFAMLPWKGVHAAMAQGTAWEARFGYSYLHARNQSALVLLVIPSPFQCQEMRNNSVSSRSVKFFYFSQDLDSVSEHEELGQGRQRLRGMGINWHIYLPGSVCSGSTSDWRAWQTDLTHSSTGFCWSYMNQSGQKSELSVLDMAKMNYFLYIWSLYLIRATNVVNSYPLATQ